MNPVSEQLAWPAVVSLGGPWIWLLWKGTCHIKSVDGDATKRRREMKHFAFFQRLGTFCCYCRVFLLFGTPLPDCGCLEGMLALRYQYPVYTTFSFLELSTVLSTFVCPLGTKVLEGRGWSGPPYGPTLATQSFSIIQPVFLVQYLSAYHMGDTVLGTLHSLTHYILTTTLKPRKFL
jgi:hypothetical protein